MTNQVMLGRDGIKLLKEMFGIEQTQVRRITLVADISEVVQMEVETFGKVGGELIDITTQDDDPETQKYMIEVRKV